MYLTTGLLDTYDKEDSADLDDTALVYDAVSRKGQDQFCLY